MSKGATDLREISLTLRSREGDRLGHLVRGVQMLRSYGKEFQLRSVSDVVDTGEKGGRPPALECRVTALSDATDEQLNAMLRETDWALGEHCLSLRLEPEGGVAGPVPGGQVYMKAKEFEAICGWGQQLSGSPAPVMGEWPGEPSG